MAASDDAARNAPTRSSADCASTSLRAHSQGIKAYAATVIPLNGGAGYSANSYEANRQIVNAFIRGGAFDGFADFDAAVADPPIRRGFCRPTTAATTIILNDAGYKVVADTFDLALFQ